MDWRHLWRTAEALGKAAPAAPVVFECVGIPGMIDQVIAGAPLFSRVVVVGVCMGDDPIRPAMAINKEIDLRFVLAYTPLGVPRHPAHAGRGQGRRLTAGDRHGRP